MVVLGRGGGWRWPCSGEAGSLLLQGGSAQRRRGRKQDCEGWGLENEPGLGLVQDTPRDSRKDI